MEKITKIRVKRPNGSFTDPTPLGADSVNITMRDGHNLEESMNNIVKISSTQPTEQSNRIWIENNNIEIEIPTMQDMDTKINKQQSIADAGKGLVINSNGEVIPIAIPTVADVNGKISKQQSVEDKNKAFVIGNDGMVGLKTIPTTESWEDFEAKAQNVINSIPEGYTELVEDVNEIKADLSEFETTIYADNYDAKTGEKDILISVEYNSGLVNPNGTITQNTSYMYTQRIPVTEGDIITGTCIDTNYGVATNLGMQRICAYHGDTAVVESGISSSVLTYTVPSGINAIIISFLARMEDVVIKRHVFNFTEYIPRISGITDKFNKMIATSSKTVVKSINPTFINGKFINKNGNINTNNSYYYFELDNIKEGDIIVARSYYNGSTSIVPPYFRYVCCYDLANVAVPEKGVENVRGSFTVPNGITKVAISIAATYPIADGVLIFTVEEIVNIFNNKNMDSAVFSAFPQSVTGTLNPSETLTLNANSVKKGKSILFKGNISASGQITIGQGTNDLNSSRYVIDDTNVTYYRGTDAVGVSHAHGLSFADYITVTISVDESHIPTITIMTNSGKFIMSENSTWVGCMPNVYVSTGATTTLTDCKLTLVCNDIDKPLWIFGDSYVSYTNDRWTYHISKMGFNDYLLNGYSGEDSPHAMQNLRNLLKYGTPKYLVWALGMNDADTNEDVNVNWKSVYDELIALCNENLITPILCTIPNVPSRSHIFKNQIVRESGYDYIDFASAVGASNDTTWFTGMLSTDGVHPTIQGGIALSSAVLKDFPYITIN